LAETVHAVAQVCCPHELETRGRSCGVISTPEIVHVQPVVEQGPSGESVSEARELLRENTLQRSSKTIRASAPSAVWTALWGES
jgi:hypothetical protein